MLNSLNTSSAVRHGSGSRATRTSNDHTIEAALLAVFSAMHAPQENPHFSFRISLQDGASSSLLRDADPA